MGDTWTSAFVFYISSISTIITFIFSFSEFDSVRLKKCFPKVIWGHRFTSHQDVLVHVNLVKRAHDWQQREVLTSSEAVYPSDPQRSRWAKHFPSGKISVFLSSGCPSFRPFEPPWWSSSSWAVIGAHSWRLRDIFIKLRCQWWGGEENKTDVSDEKGTADSLYLSPMVTSQWEPDAVSGGGASAGGRGGPLAGGRRVASSSGFFTPFLQMSAHLHTGTVGHQNQEVSRRKQRARWHAHTRERGRSAQPMFVQSLAQPVPRKWGSEHAWNLAMTFRL